MQDRPENVYIFSSSEVDGLEDTRHSSSVVPSTVSDRRRVATNCIDFRPKQAARWAQSADCEAPRPFRVICMGESAAAQITAPCQTTSGETAVTERAERAFSTQAPDNGPRGCKVILLIIQQAAVRCKERTKTKKTERRRGLCPKSPRRCCLLIHSGVSVSQSVLSKIPTLS